MNGIHEVVGSTPIGSTRSETKPGAQTGVRLLSLWGLALMALAACSSSEPGAVAGGVADAQDAADSDAVSGSDAVSEADSDAVADSDADSDSDAEVDSGADADAEVGGGCPATPQPEEVEAIDAVASVTFVLSNTTAADLWFGEYGTNCNAWQVSGVVHATGWSCGCECAAPPGSFVAGWRRIPSGESRALVWDGRGLATWTVSINCCEEGWGEDAGFAETLGGAWQPVAAGPRTLTLFVAKESPCGWDGESETTDCIYDDMEPVLPPQPAALCSDELPTLEVPFELPAEGELTVDVDLGASPSP